MMSDNGYEFEQERWQLHLLCVDPHFQGKGVGKMLVDEGKERARKDKSCVRLVCGDHNKKWYERAGLKEVSQFPAGELEVIVGEGAWVMGWDPAVTP